MFDLSTIFHPKIVVSAITGVVATGAAFRRDLATLIGGQSLISQIKEEEARVKEIDKSLQDLTGDGEDGVATRQVFENDRRVTFERLQRLTAEFSRRREDPNYDLSLIQRLLLSFRPESGCAEVIRWLAYMFMALGLIAIFIWVSFLNRGAARDDIGEYIADLALLGCFGFLVFRGWALAERRAIHKYDSGPSLLKDALILKRPQNAQVVGAQACFWISAFWMVEGLEDALQDMNTPQGEDPVKVGLIKFLVPLLAMILCRFWAAAESRRAEASSTPSSRLFTLLRLHWSNLAIALCVAGFAGFTTLVLRSHLPLEGMHKVALVMQCLILCIACGQLFILLARPAPSPDQQPIREDRPLRSIA
jgi:hypothetical protein